MVFEFFTGKSIYKYIYFFVKLPLNFLVKSLNIFISLRNLILSRLQRYFPKPLSMTAFNMFHKEAKRRTGDGVAMRELKAATADMRYSARSKFSMSLVHKKSFGLIWEVVFKLRYLFYNARQDNSFQFEWNRRSHNRQLFYINLLTNHNQTLISL